MQDWYLQTFLSYSLSSMLTILNILLMDFSVLFYKIFQGFPYFCEESVSRVKVDAVFFSHKNYCKAKLPFPLNLNDYVCMYG